MLTASLTFVGLASIVAVVLLFPLELSARSRVKDKHGYHASPYSISTKHLFGLASTTVNRDAVAASYAAVGVRNPFSKLHSQREKNSTQRDSSCSVCGEHCNQSISTRSAGPRFRETWRGCTCLVSQSLRVVRSGQRIAKPIGSRILYHD